MLLSRLYVRFRDIQPIWEVFSQMLFYGSPILYPIQIAAQKNKHLFGISFARILVINPLGAILTQVRKALLDTERALGRPRDRRRLRLLIPLGIIAGDLRPGPMVLQPRGPADLGEPVTIRHRASTERAASRDRTPARPRRGARGRARRGAGHAPTRRSPRRRSAPTGSSAGTSTSTRDAPPGSQRARAAARGAQPAAPGAVKAAPKRRSALTMARTPRESRASRW